MSSKRTPIINKVELHPCSKHHGRYDLPQLIECCPELSKFVKINDYGDLSIDFFNPEAVRMLNTALLIYFYDIRDWNIPKNYLCPPIPGRADYIHYIADLFCKDDVISREIKCLDIGVGANCIYPIIGVKEYGWSFIGADIDPVAIKSAKAIIAANPDLIDKIEIRLQNNPHDIFKGILLENEYVNVSMCNPPFHASSADAQFGTLRKLTNLTGKKITKPRLNFGGQDNELYCAGGELQFIKKMILQSKEFSKNCQWFTTIVSKQSNLNGVYQALKKAEVQVFKTVSMGQGSKISRFVAWSFFNL